MWMPWLSLFVTDHCYCVVLLLYYVCTLSDEDGRVQFANECISVVILLRCQTPWRSRRTCLWNDEVVIWPYLKTTARCPYKRLIIPPVHTGHEKISFSCSSNGNDGGQKRKRKSISSEVNMRLRQSRLYKASGYLPVTVKLNAKFPLYVTQQ